MKICYLCADPGIPLNGHKGAAGHVRSMLQAFGELGHQVNVITWRGEAPLELGAPVDYLRKPKFVDGLAGQVEPRLQRALGHLWNNAAVEATLESVLARSRPDLIYERYSPFAIAGALSAQTLAIPHLLEVNAPLAREGAQYRRQALTEVATALEHSVFASTTLIRCVSNQLREELLEAGVVAEKIRVVPNGVDPRRFSPAGPRYAELKHRFVIGFVGSLKPWHGLDPLLEAFHLLLPEPRFHLLIVGNGQPPPALAALHAQQPERLTLVHNVPQTQVPYYLRAMDVALAPYPKLERFYFSPLKVYEYMAAGRAIIASRIGQLVELIDDGHTGLLVPPGDAQALAATIRDVAEQPAWRRELGERAAAQARAQHNWRQRAAAILEHARSLG